MKNYFKSLLFFTKHILNIISLIYNRRRGKIIIIFIGQTHSPHFESFIKTLKISKEKYQYGTVCSFPHHDPQERAIYDISWKILFGNKTPDLDEFSSNLYNSAINLVFSKKLNQLLDYIKPEILWLHEIQSSSTLLNIEQLNFDFKLFTTTYGNDLKFFINHPQHKKILDFILSKSQLIHVETKEEVKILQAKRFKGEIIQGSATLRKLSFLKKIEFNKKNIDFLVRGGNPYRNSTDFLYELLQIHYSKLKEIKVVIFDCTEYELYRFHLLKSKYNLNITALSRLKQSHIHDLMEKSKFLIANSYSDGVSNLCLESWAKGCLVLTTPQNGFSEFLAHGSKVLDFNVKKNSCEFYLDLLNFYKDTELVEEIYSSVREGLTLYLSHNKDLFKLE